MNAHHYLGFRPIVGQSLWYVATCEEQWVALLGWGAAALKCAPRDAWIGWRPALKFRRLYLLANNVRFLILPEWASAEPRLAGFSSQSPTPESRLGTLLWASPPAGGDFCGCGPLSWHLLSRRRLAGSWHHTRFRQARPGLCGPRPAQVGVGSSAASASPREFDRGLLAALPLPRKGSESGRCWQADTDGEISRLASSRSRRPAERTWAAAPQPSSATHCSSQVATYQRDCPTMGRNPR